MKREIDSRKARSNFSKYRSDNGSGTRNDGGLDCLVYPTSGEIDLNEDFISVNLRFDV